MWIESEYSASDYGTRILDNILGKRELFSYPKAPRTVADNILAMSSNFDSITLDYFAGSGTTGHAVINLNRADGGQRKYVLVEMGEYFNTVTKPRIQKVIYSAEWKNGKPVERAGSSHMFKYVRLESYEDTLNNVQLQRSPAQANMLADHDQLREQYVLGYMLDVESRGSASLLNQSAFTQPFAYTLQIAKGGSVAESVPTVVDLVETFNYLIGMRVKRMCATTNMRLVAGTTPDGLRTLVVWRDGELLRNQHHLWSALTAHELGAQLGTDYDVIYVNGDTALASHLPSTCQVRHTDTEFHARMFADSAY